MKRLCKGSSVLRPRAVCVVRLSQFLILSPGGDKIVPLFGNLFKDEPVPKDGYAAVTTPTSGVAPR